jgi:hypothetical protein
VSEGHAVRQSPSARAGCGVRLRRLNGGGVLIFTIGGTDQPGEVQDDHMGVPMYTATMGVPKMRAVLRACEGGQGDGGNRDAIQPIRRGPSTTGSHRKKRRGHLQGSGAG